jgi:hypothetical protein
MAVSSMHFVASQCKVYGCVTTSLELRCFLPKGYLRVDKQHVANRSVLHFTGDMSDKRQQGAPLNNDFAPYSNFTLYSAALNGCFGGGYHSLYIMHFLKCFCFCWFLLKWDMTWKYEWTGITVRCGNFFDILWLQDWLCILMTWMRATIIWQHCGTIWPKLWNND